MNAKRRVIVVSLMAALCMGLVAIGWVLGARRGVASLEAEPRSATGAAMSSEPASAEGALVHFEGVTSTPPPRASTMPLPGPLPPADLYVQLAPLARAGDSAAACRLGLELAACRNARFWRGSRQTLARRQLDTLVDGDLAQLQAAERQLSWMEWQEQRARDCSALPAEAYREGPRLMLQAALQGNRGSMVDFASLHGVGGEELVADPALYAQYRQYAFPAWRQAFESGSVDAIFVWAQALDSNGFQFFAGVLPPEYHDRDLALALRAELFAALQEGQRTPDVATPVQPEASFDADTVRRARELFDRQFRHSPDLERAKRRAARERSAAASSTLTPQAQHALRVESFNERCGGPR